MRRQASNVPRTLEFTAHAKLNLTLRVTGRRADGYHLLDSLTAFVAFGDRIRFRLGDTGDRLTVSGRFAGALAGINIAATARDRFRAVTGWLQAIEIEIDKQIPVAGGLGGGSSNAAVVLRALRQLMPGAPPAHDVMRGLAVSLGADVPVCLRGEATRMRGIGACLHPIGLLPEVAIILVNPGIEVSSATIFRGFSGPYSGPRAIGSRRWSDDDLFEHLEIKPRNDLLPRAVMLAPVIRDVLAFLERLPGVRCHGMSGSGATCFAVLDASAEARIGGSLDLIRDRGWWAVATRLITQERSPEPN